MELINKWNQKASPLPRILLFELLYKVFIWIVIRPSINFILNITLTVSGYQLAFNDMMVGFLFSLPGIIAAILLIALSAIFTYMEFSVILILSGCGFQNRHPSLRYLINETKNSMRNLLHPSTLAFCLYVMGLLPVVGLGFTSSLLPELSIPNFIIGELQKSAWGGYLLIFVAVIIFSIFLVSIFTMPVMVLEKSNFGKAFIRGIQFTWCCRKQLLGVYAGFFLLWGLLCGLPQFVFNQVFGTASVTFTMIVSVFGVSWESFILAALLIVYVIVQLILMPLLLYFVVGRYCVIGGKIKLSTPPSDKEPVRINSKLLNMIKKIPNSVRIIGFIVVLLFLTYNVITIFNNPPGLHYPIVIGHRGSAYGVENTLNSIQGSIDADADYAEIDIHLSSDGIPMVIHDVNLSRLTGENVNVYDLTAEQLQHLELEQNGYTGSIPSLEEVVQFCQGKIGLAVEIKLHGYEQENVIDKTMSVLQKYDMIDNCIFVSLEYTLIEDINTQYPQAAAGYCVYGNVGDLNPSIIRDMKIDFVVIEESMVNRDNLYNFRGAWLPVYVWTVNDKVNMQHYLELGVIGIVTDYPDIGKNVIEEYINTANPVYLDESEWMD